MVALAGAGLARLLMFGESVTARQSLNLPTFEVMRLVRQSDCCPERKLLSPSLDYQQRTNGRTA